MHLIKDRDRTLIIDLLNSTFKDNKSVNFILKQDPKIDSRRVALIEYCIEIVEEFGEIFLNDEGTACALLLNENKTKVGFKSIQRDLNFAFNIAGIGNIPKILKREKLLKEKTPEGDFMHLWFIAVDQNKQGEGIGSKFLQELKMHYHKIGYGIYLETSTSKNINFYKRNGFELHHTIGTDELGYQLFLFRTPSNKTSTSTRIES